MTVQRLLQRVAQLEQRCGADQPKIVVKGALFGPQEWRDAEGWGLYFVNAWTVPPMASDP